MPIPCVARAHLAQLLPVLKPIAVRPVPPRTPWNFRATANSSGNALCGKPCLVRTGMNCR